jgi:putative SOS response-associated peptidase YedK
MCGRYQRKADKDDIIKYFELVENLEYFEKYQASDEIFPGTEILAINKLNRPENVYWTIRDKSWDGKMVATVNAKAENLTKAAMFKQAFANDRILIPATALFEWQEQSDKSKIKFKISFDEPLFAFAGIARDCEIKGKIMRCGVIVTTYPNDIFREIHNTRQRQAVVIRKADYNRWLDSRTSVAELKDLMKPLPDSETHAKRADSV